MNKPLLDFDRGVPFYCLDSGTNPSPPKVGKVTNKSRGSQLPLQVTPPVVWVLVGCLPGSLDSLGIRGQLTGVIHQEHLAMGAGHPKRG